MTTRKEVETLLKNAGIGSWQMPGAVNDLEKLLGEPFSITPEFKDGDRVSITRIEEAGTAFHWAGTVYTGVDGDLVLSLPFGGEPFPLEYFASEFQNLYTVEKVGE